MFNEIIQNPKLKVFCVTVLSIVIIGLIVVLWGRSEKDIESVIEEQYKILKNCSVRPMFARLTGYDNCIKCTGVYKYVKGRKVLVHSKYCDGRVSKNINTRAILKYGYGIAAVDPKMIYYGSIIIFEKRIYIAIDRSEPKEKGGKIYGNRIDIFFDKHSEARKFGVKKRWVVILVPSWKVRHRLLRYIRKYDKKLQEGVFK